MTTPEQKRFEPAFAAEVEKWARFCQQNGYTVCASTPEYMAWAEANHTLIRDPQYREHCLALAAKVKKELE